MLCEEVRTMLMITVTPDLGEAKRGANCEFGEEERWDLTYAYVVLIIASREEKQVTNKEAIAIIQARRGGDRERRGGSAK